LGREQQRRQCFVEASAEEVSDPNHQRR
jgi:hypothetical protein